MPPPPETTSAVMLVRVWLEGGELVRARITENTDLVDRRDEIVHDVATSAEIEIRLHSWLERMSLPAVTPR